MNKQTQEKQKHSPTPYTLQHPTHENKLTHSKIFDSNEWEVCETNGNNLSEVEANAEFIVKACNSHYELVEIAEAYLRRIQDNYELDPSGKIEEQIKNILSIGSK